MLILLASGGGPRVWAAVAVLGMSQGVNTLLRVTLLVDLYGTARFGALNGLSATPVVLARALAPLGAAYLADATGGYAMPFLLLAGAAAAAAAIGGRRVQFATARPVSVAEQESSEASPRVEPAAP